MIAKRRLRYYLGTFLRPLIKSYKKLYSRFSFTGDVEIHFDSKKLAFHCNQQEISNSIYYSGIFGDFEGESLRLWKECIVSLNPRLILDIGAYSGIYSCMAALYSDKSIIHAFEPNEVTFKILERNISLNAFTNIIPCNYGISTSSGEQTFYNSGNTASAAMSSVNHRYVNKDLGEIRFQVRDFLEVNESFDTKIDMIKMDIERAELPIIKHIKHILNKDRPIIFCEILDQDEYPKFGKLFDEIGYKYLKIDDKNKCYHHVSNMSMETPVGLNWIFYPMERSHLFSQ
jgi:FkbM family methyltransferase